MILEDCEMPNGSPLGLGNLNMRLRVTKSLHPTATEPRPLHAPSSSFSSFSSSNLDTKSTASFFQDHCVSLGQLIGIRSRERGSVYFPNASRFEQRESIREKIVLGCPRGTWRRNVSGNLCSAIGYHLGEDEPK